MQKLPDKALPALYVLSVGWGSAVHRHEKQVEIRPTGIMGQLLSFSSHRLPVVMPSLWLVGRCEKPGRHSLERHTDGVLPGSSQSSFIMIRQH